MDPLIGSTLLKVGGSLLGGLLGKKAPSAGQNAYSHVGGIMKAAQQYNFNPLALLGAVSPMGGGASQNYMGEAISDAASLLADDLAKKGAVRGVLNKYEEQNAQLQTQVDKLSLRPTVPGIYNGGGDAGTGGAAAAAGNSGASGAGGGFWTGHADRNWSDPDIRSSSDDGSRVPVKPLYWFGGPVRPASGTSDAQAFADRYGEDFLSPSWFAGWSSFGVDAVVNAYDVYQEKVGRPSGRALDTAFQWATNPARRKPRIGHKTFENWQFQ